MNRAEIKARLLEVIGRRDDDRASLEAHDRATRALRAATLNARKHRSTR